MLTLKREACSLSLSLVSFVSGKQVQPALWRRKVVPRDNCTMLSTYHVFWRVKGARRPPRRMRHYNPARLCFMFGPHHQSVRFGLHIPIIVLHPIRFELGTLCPCRRQSRAKHFSFLNSLRYGTTWLTIISSNTYFYSIEALPLLFLGLMRNTAF